MPWAVTPGVVCPVCGATITHASSHWTHNGRNVIVTIQHADLTRTPCEWIVSALRYMTWEGKMNVR